MPIRETRFPDAKHAVRCLTPPMWPSADGKRKSITAIRLIRQGVLLNRPLPAKLIQLDLLPRCNSVTPASV